MNKLDIIVLGATGYTGKYVAKNLAKLNVTYSEIKWGISGRSTEKLNNLMTELMESGADKNRIPLIECNIDNVESIKEATKRAKVLINCTGPNTVLSDPIVNACIQTGTHYVDISAELHHMLNIYEKYNKAAEDVNILIVVACGFATIPATVGLSLLEKQFKGTLHLVECYTKIGIPKKAYFPWFNRCLIHYGTWASLVHELQNYRKYNEHKNKLFPQLASKTDPQELKRSFFHWRDGRFWFPYPGPEHGVIDISELYLQEKKQKRPVYVKLYTTMPLFIHFFLIIPVFFFYYFACYFSCFRALLWKFPRLFTLGYVSHKGPSDEMKTKTTYNFTLNGKGWNEGDDMKSAPKKTLSVKVSGCDPGYQTTSVACIFSAVTILNESHNMPKGGVLTTGSAFNDTTIAEKLNASGINIEVLDAKKSELN